MSKHLKMLLGGSPCTHWSIAQKNNRETEQTGRRISSKTRKLEILAERRGGSMNENIKEIVNIIGNAELSNECHKECFINTDFDNECTLCRQATALYIAGYRKQSETVKEIIKKILAFSYYIKFEDTNGKDREELVVYESKIKQIAEQYGKEELI